MTRALVTTPLFLLLGAGPLVAQPVASAQVPARLTLEEALARATANSHRLAELRAREGASGAVLAQGRAADLPVVSLQAGYARTNHVDEFGVFQPDGSFRLFYPDVPDNWQGRLDVRWPIYSGGRVGALERAADAEREASGKDLEQARADLRLETTRAFWALVTAAESVRVVRGSVGRIEAQLADVRARFDQGFLPPNDVLTVEARVSQQRTLLIQTENQRDAARAELARLIGAPLDARFDADGQLPPAPASDVTAGGAGSRPTPAGEPGPPLDPSRADREAQLLRVRAAEERVEAAEAGARPSLAVVAGFDYARPNPKIFPREDVWQSSWDVGINVTWSLWNGGRTAAEASEARQLAEATRQRLADLDSVIALEVRQRALDLESARAQVVTAAAAARSAAEAQRVVRERFEAGVATNSDLLDAQVDLLEAELDLTRARATVRLAEARLARARGLL